MSPQGRRHLKYKLTMYWGRVRAAIEDFLSENAMKSPLRRTQTHQAPTTLTTVSWADDQCSQCPGGAYPGATRGNKKAAISRDVRVQAAILL